MTRRGSTKRALAGATMALAFLLSAGGAARAADAFFSAELASPVLSVDAVAQAQITIPVDVTNTSSSIWADMGDEAIYLSYQVLERGVVVNSLGVWTNLSPAMGPGESRRVNMAVDVPGANGSYTLLVDLIRGADRTWFASYGSQPISIGLNVTGGSGTGDAKGPGKGRGSERGHRGEKGGSATAGLHRANAR